MVSELSRIALLPYMRVARALKLPLLIANPFAIYRQPLHAPGFPLVLLYTGKAGSGSLIKWFLFQTGHLEEPADLHRGLHQRQRSLAAQQPGYHWEALRLIVRHEKPIFKLVRNPYDRAVSSFLAMLDHTQDRKCNPWGLAPIAAARKLSGKPAATVPALSFRDFVRFLVRTGTERGEINGHVARQHLPGEERRIDRILKLERFAEEMRQIESEYSLARSPVEVIGRPHNQQSRPQMERNRVDCVADLEFTPQHVREGHFPPYAAFYDDETRRLVRQCFAADFDAYGYDS